MNDYKKLLKHPKWQKKRLEILKRDDFQCQLCKDKETTLHIHHQKYKYGNKPWEYDDELLLTVCEDCHSLIHFHEKNNNPLQLEGIKVMKDKIKNEPTLFVIIENGYELKMTVLDQVETNNYTTYSFV